MTSSRTPLPSPFTPSPETAAEGADADLGSLSGFAAGLLAMLADAAPVLWVVARREEALWTPVAMRGPCPRPDDRPVPIPWHDSLCARLVSGQGPAFAPRLYEVPAYREAPQASALAALGYLGVPVFDVDGSVFGTLCAYLWEPFPLDPEHWQTRMRQAGALLAQWLRQCRHAEQMAERLAQRERDSRTDALTGLLNRRGWEEAIASEQARIEHAGRGAGVLLLDLDRLKHTNDRHGHAAGDALIRACARVLRGQARPFDSVARIGGGEFGALLSGMPAGGTAQWVALVFAALEAIGVTADAGWALADPRCPIAQALEAADQELRRQKQMRRR